MTPASTLLAEQFAEANLDQALLLLSPVKERVNFTIVIPLICTPLAASEAWGATLKDVLGADATITNARQHRGRIWLRGHFKETSR